VTVVAAVSKPTRVLVDPECIAVLPEFIARQGDRDPAHIRTLAQVVRAGSLLDPLLLWRDPESGANALTLLDGAYRLSAYRTAKWTGLIPARIVECSRKEALLLAAGANSKDRKGLTPHEKQDFAWRLVRDEGVTFSKAELVRATGVSDRSIARMRARWRQLREQPEVIVTGRWWRDREDAQSDREFGEELSDAAKEAAIREHVTKLRDLLDRRKGHPILSDKDAVFEIVVRALGEPHDRALAHYILGGSDEADDWMDGDVERVGNYSHLTEFVDEDDEEDNPDF
jgi:hypothetical protein